MSVFVDEIKQLLPVSHISIHGFELIWGKNDIVTIRHPANHNNECCIWNQCEITSHLFAHTLSQIPRLSFVASPSIFSHLPNFACTFLQNHLHQLLMNPLGIIEIIQRKPGFRYLQKIWNRCLSVQGSITKMFQPVLSPEYGPIHFLKQRSHPYFLPLVECATIGLPHPFGKLLQGELCLLQADWGFTVCTTQVQRIIALIICIIFVIGNLRQWGQIRNCCNM